MSFPVHKQDIPTGTFLLYGRAIHAAEQYGEPVVWFIADGFSRRYELVMTGMAPQDGWVHVVSFLADGGAFVGHLFTEPDR